MSDSPLEMARWQGSIDERTKMIERRMDALNGDVAIIRNDIGEIKQSVRSSAEFRDGWRPMLEQIRKNNEITDALHAQRQRGFTRRQKLLSALVAAAVLGLQAFQSFH